MLLLLPGFVVADGCLSVKHECPDIQGMRSGFDVRTPMLA